MQITDVNSNWSTQGFDALSPGGASVKTFAPAVGATPDQWIGIASTNNPIKTTNGYICYIRGDRLSLSINGVINPTVLRTKGQIFRNDITHNVNPNKFEVIGNPYPSSIDLRTITQTNLSPDLYIWDPYLGGNYGLGGYRTLTLIGGNYQMTPSGGSGPYAAAFYNYLNSGMAFFVRGGGSGSGSVTFHESDKNVISDLASRGGNTDQILRTQIYNNVNGTETMLDGVLSIFNSRYADTVDFNDAGKMSNTNLNMSLRRDGKMLSVERRSMIHNADTIYLNLASVRVSNYVFTFQPMNLDNPARKAWLVDKYKNTQTEISLSDSITRYNFDIQNVPGSYNADRFYIIFKTGKGGLQPVVKPDTIVTPGAITLVVSKPIMEEVKGIDVSSPKLSVFPNPVRDRNLNVVFDHMAPGNYTFELIHQNGQVVYRTEQRLNSTIDKKILSVSKTLSAGVYLLKVTNATTAEVNNLSVILE
jgi:hypothetical protein